MVPKKVLDVFVRVALFYLIARVALPSTIAISLSAAYTVLATTHRFEMLQKSREWLSSRWLITKDNDTIALFKALKSLQNYSDNCVSSTNHKRSLYKSMPIKHQRLGNSIHYPEKLNQIDQCFRNNQAILDKVVESALKHYKLSQADISKVTSSQHSQVVEGLCHYARDWASIGDEEVQPLIEYVKEKSRAIKDFKNTFVVVPGSGLGRIAHELACESFGKVIGVEYSWTMHLLNQFIYTQGFDFHPYVHTNSNHLSLQEQTRKVAVSKRQRPDILTNVQGDFLKMENKNPYKHVIFVTCFFMDTAEDIFSYMDKIDQMCSAVKGKKLWINMGPLKYGTAPKVEFTNEELLKVITENYGWHIDHQIPKPVKLGYMTDTHSMWQGYYGVNMWCASK